MVPTETATYWAWVVPNPRSAMLIGAGYFAGIFYFSLALRSNAWEQVRNGLSALLLFSLFLLFASILHWEPFRPYHPYTLIWLSIYYGGPLLIPVTYRVQMARATAEPAEGPEISPAWRTWLVLHGVYLAVALIAFVFAEPLAANWPWQIQPLELRTFLGQVAAVGWLGVVSRADVRAWKRHGLGVILIGVLGVLQLAGILFYRAPYNLASPLGILLPLMFGEWILTSLLMIVRYERK